ncbi:MAG: GNAT family N-acetyltransferase [Anaerolineae bacterium]|nr:GNAT family N-acetyltransferase [Anaerolineae bacterium]
MNPMLLDLPDQFETERLLMRIPRPGEGTAVRAGIRESVAAISPWMGWATDDLSVEETEARNRQAAAAFLAREALRFLMWRKTDGAFVGGVNVIHPDWVIGQFEIGYWLRTSMEGSGYMTEAVQGITAYAFEHLGARRLELFCDPRNARSAAVAERAGFTLEARLDQSWRGVHGELVDSLMYVRLSPDERDMRPSISFPRPDMRLLHPVPERLETDRLRLRIPQAGDGPPVYAAVIESLAHLKPWMPWANHAQTLEQIELHQRSAALQFMRREGFHYSIEDRKSGAFIGKCSLFDLNWDIPSGEMGYWVRVGMQGQGYVTEAAQRLVEMAWQDLGLERIEIRCDARNTRSAAVAERIGFTLEARFRHHRRAPDGSLGDTLVYAKLRGDA